jgi:hypothetical protein
MARAAPCPSRFHGPCRAARRAEAKAQARPATGLGPARAGPFGPCRARAGPQSRASGRAVGPRAACSGLGAPGNGMDGGSETARSRTRAQGSKTGEGGRDGGGALAREGKLQEQAWDPTRPGRMPPSTTDTCPVPGCSPLYGNTKDFESFWGFAG